MPKFIVFVRANSATETNEPTPQELADMGAYNAQLADAGILLSAEGLRPSSEGARVTFDASNAFTVTRGPFAVESLVSGFWIWECKDMEEALAWARKAPFRVAGGQTTEVRRIAGMEDFEGMRGHVREAEETLRRRVERK